MSSSVKGLGAAGNWRWVWVGLIGCGALACTEPNSNDNVSTGVVGDDPASDAGGRGASNPTGNDHALDAGATSSVSPTATPPTATPTTGTTSPPVVSAPAVSNPAASGLATGVPSASAPESVLDAGAPELDPPSQPLPLVDAGSPVTEPTDESTTDDTTDDDEWGLDRMDDPIENPVECPAEEPVVGDACSAILVCKYGSEPDCRSRWTCSGESWWMEYAKRDCSDSCPIEEPTEGAPCEGQSMQCLYGDDPTCRSNWMCYDQQWWLLDAAQECNPGACPEEPPLNGLSCNPEVDPQSCSYPFAEGCSCSCWWDGDVPHVEWYCGVTQAGYPPEYLTACPNEQPIEGTFCDSSSTCGYVTLEECKAAGAGTTLANCVENKWVLTLPGSTQ